MPTKILEFHGYEPLSNDSKNTAAAKWCPFIDVKCKKTRSGGACALQGPSSPPVIICPNRLYADEFKVIRNIAHDVFGADAELVTELDAKNRFQSGALTGCEVVVYGQGFSGEVGIKAPSNDGENGTFKIDFLLAKICKDLSLGEIVAVEVQTIDTTNSYSDAAKSYYSETPYPGHGKNPQPGWTKAGFNWENVTKRILPQLIYTHIPQVDR